MMKLPLLSFLIVFGVGNAQECPKECQYPRNTYEGLMERLPGKLTAEPSVLTPDQLETLNEIRQGLGKSILEFYHELEQYSYEREIAEPMFEWQYRYFLNPEHLSNQENVSAEVQEVYFSFLNPDSETFGNEALDQKAVDHPELKDAFMKLKKDLRGLLEKLKPFCLEHLEMTCTLSEEEDDEEEADTSDDDKKGCKK